MWNWFPGDCRGRSQTIVSGGGGGADIPIPLPVEVTGQPIQIGVTGQPIQVTGAVQLQPRLGPVQSRVIDALGTSVVIVPAAPGQTTEIVRLFFVIDRATTIQLATPSITFTGPIAVTAGSSFVFDDTDRLWFSAGDDVLLTVTPAAQVSGHVWYVQA